MYDEVASHDATRLDPLAELGAEADAVSGASPVVSGDAQRSANEPPPDRRQRSVDSATVHDVQLEADPVRRFAARPGERLAGTRYRILRWLGDGGMGTVFEAVHEDLERSVALKVLRRVGTERHLRLFRQEAKTLAKLRSRYAVEVYDFVELSDGRLAIAMELLRGETLRDAIRDDTLPPARLIPILRQVCKGLSAAHAEGIVHRDIKPENISLEELDGRPDAVKLLDFGIAQVAGSTSGKQSRAGTPGYLAPEVVSGLGCDARSDIYSVGCVAYELTTGRRPFVNEDPSVVLLAQIGESPISPSVHADIPRPIEQVILRCLEKNPDERYRNVADLEAALCEAQIEVGMETAWDDLPLPEVEGERRERLLRSMPHPADEVVRGRTWWPLVLAAALLLVGVTAAVVWNLRAPQENLAAVSVVDALTVDARAAAAKAFFVYPPPEDPSTPTAFAKVRLLERQKGAAAEPGRARARELRSEFADTLERLGDKYWESDNGRAFALDYYAEALVFEPGRERVRERASMTPGELRLLRDKAEDSSFSAAELSVMEPLIALAEQDDEARAARVTRIARSSSPIADRRATQLGELIPHPPMQPTERSVEEEAAEEPVAAEGNSKPAVAVDAEPVDEPEATPRDARNPKEARKLAGEGRAAHQAGKSAKAERLFAAALAADRRHGAAYAGLGRVAFDRGSYALAARMLAKAVRLGPRQARLRIELGDAYFKAFDYSKARAQYERAEQLGSKAAAGRLAKLAAKGR